MRLSQRLDYSVKIHDYLAWPKYVCLMREKKRKRICGREGMCVCMPDASLRTSLTRAREVHVLNLDLVFSGSQITCS